MIAVRRGFFGAQADQFIGNGLGLPPEICSFTMTAVQIPVSEGIDRFELAADLFQPILPDGGKPLGTVFSMGPYGRGYGMVLTTRLLAARGYQGLFVSCRGTCDSGGEFDPACTDFEDAHAAVGWMRKQPWYTGSFATFGASYMGYTQYALLSDPPPDMAAAAITIAPHDFCRHHWGTGSLNLGLLSWADLVGNQGNVNSLWEEFKRPYLLLTAGRRLRPIIDAVPLCGAADAHFKDMCPWLHKKIVTGDTNDPLWAAAKQHPALEKAQIPILLIAGWQDIFLEQMMDQYARLRERGCPVSLVIGPWTHSQAGQSKEHGMVAETLGWLEQHLAGKKEFVKVSPVDIYVTGAEEWRSLPAWPPKTERLDFYLRCGKRLAKEGPMPEDEPSSQFTFDPSNPTRIVGGAKSFGASLVDDSILASQPDILTFTTEPLDNDLETLGRIAVELAHSSNNPHVDLFVRISEVDSQGLSQNVTEIYRRLEPEKGPRQVRLELKDCAHRFKRGNCIRLIVAGGCHPAFARNLGTGDNQATGTKLVSATHALHHSETVLSRVLFPIFS